ncbi:histidine--tRNA ligase [bacterium]|nr:histidine--tRNA ligase [bacterium]
MQALQAIRGMNDILGADAARWRTVLGCTREVIESYGYGEIWLPLLEKTELFHRSIGAVTDIVEKEMYTFDDRNGDSLTLRPEGTAGVVRAFIQNGLHRAGPQRLWMSGPMFRHERPQAGRYRQFHQFSVEAMGMEGPDIDAELIAMGAALWKRLGIDDALTLELNSLGTPESRATYRAALTDYLRGFEDALDDDSRRRLGSNPMRVLDSKNPALADIINGAPQLPDYLDDASKQHFDGVRERLDALGIAYTLNPRLVRGLDYYSRTVFEWVTDRLGAQNAVCSGGRYDGLVEQLGGQATPAVGFGLGIERMVALVEQAEASDGFAPQVYLAALGEAAEAQAPLLAEQLRDHGRGLRVQLNAGGGSFKAQLKRADRCGAAFAVILGDNEVQTGQATVKPLRSDAAQETVAQSQLSDFIRERLRGDSP